MVPMADKTRDLGQIKLRFSPEETKWWHEVAKAYGLKKAQRLIMTIVEDYFHLWKANEDLQRKQLGKPPVVLRERPVVIDEHDLRNPQDVIFEEVPAGRKEKPSHNRAK